MHWTDNLTKAQKRELHRIAGLAHERELTAVLSELEEQFRRWRAGEIEAHDLNEEIHKFHQGPSRKLWSRYTNDPASWSALFAIESGVVAEHEVSADVLEILGARKRVPSSATGGDG